MVGLGKKTLVTKLSLCTISYEHPSYLGFPSKVIGNEAEKIGISYVSFCTSISLCSANTK